MSKWEFRCFTIAGKSRYYRIFYLVATSLLEIRRHPQAKLYPSELATIGILFLLKGGYFRAFYRWLKRDYGDWFGDGTLPERTRLKRRLKTHQDWCSLLLVDPTFFTVIDSYPTELIFAGFYADIVSVWRKPDGIRGNSGKNRYQQAKNFVLRKSCFTGGEK